MPYNNETETIINGHTIKFCVDFMDDDMYELSFWINGTMERLAEDKQQPAITRWVLTTFKNICKWADEKGYVLTASAYDADKDFDMRVKAYSKYMERVGPNVFIYGNEANPVYTEYKDICKRVNVNVDFSFMND